MAEDDCTKEYTLLVKKIDEVVKATQEGSYIFRGENEEYEKISCTLYREQKENIKNIKGIKQEEILKVFNYPTIEKEIIKNAR